jgi:FtsP/CotA-like multicopper oxidase with cupredoxin domain
MFNKFQEIYVMNRFGGGGGGGGMGGGGGGQSTGGRRTFSYLAAPTTLNTSMGSSETMANGTSINTWNFNNGGGFNGNRSVPGPVVEANQGSNVQITLSSMMMLPHTIHLHGLDVDQQNDGVPATSFSVSGGSYTYTFTAPHAGTYQYHCHVDTHQHYEAGMFGTIIIRPSNGSTSVAWAGGPSFDKEYIWQLTTYDSSWHSGMGGGGGGGGMGGGGAGDLIRYNPDYFMINGKDGANANNDSATAISAAAGQKVLIRINGTSYMPGIVRMGGLPFEVIASDGRPLAQSYTTTEQLCCAGERYDILLTMPSSGSYTGSIEYRNIQNNSALGTATTTITVA